MKRFRCLLLVVTLTPGGAAYAAQTTSPYLITEQETAPTGILEWDELSGMVTIPSLFPPGPPGPLGSVGSFGTATPDVADIGPGDGAVSLNFQALPFNGPPVPVETSTGNIYVGGTLADFDVALTNLDNSESFTTVVLQLGVAGEVSSFLLDGAAPTVFVDRGFKVDVEHGSAAAPFDTRYYWAEWQVASATDYLIEFSAEAHQSLAQVRVDYFNAPEPFAATPAGEVPEPAAAVLLPGGFLLAGVRRQRSGCLS